MSEQKKATYTIEEARIYLNVSDTTIRRWISRGLLRTSKSLRKKIIPAEDVEKFVEKTC